MIALCSRPLDRYDNRLNLHIKLLSEILMIIEIFIRTSIENSEGRNNVCMRQSLLLHMYVSGWRALAIKQ